MSGSAVKQIKTPESACADVCMGLSLLGSQIHVIIIGIVRLTIIKNISLLVITMACRQGHHASSREWLGIIVGFQEAFVDSLSAQLQIGRRGKAHRASCSPKVQQKRAGKQHSP